MLALAAGAASGQGRAEADAGRAFAEAGAAGAIAEPGVAAGRAPAGARAESGAATAHAPAEARAESEAPAAHAPVGAAGFAEPALVSAPERAGDGAVRVDSPEGGFRAIFPEAPRFDSVLKKTLLGSLHSRSWEVERGTLRLRVERHDLPAVAARMLPAEWLLARAERDLLAHHEARAVETEAAPWGAHPGRRLRYEPGARPGERETARIVIAGRRIYVLFARGAGAAAPLAEQFAESVEILAE